MDQDTWISLGNTMNAVKLLSYDKGFEIGAKSRQQEVDQLQTEINELKRQLHEIDKLSTPWEEFGELPINLNEGE